MPILSLEYTFDIKLYRCYYNYKSATDRRLALNFIGYKDNRQVSQAGRLFLCPFIALRADRVSEREAGNTQADDGDK